MIDPILLKQLGWSENLISEVLRAADNLQKTNKQIAQNHTSQFQTEPSTTLYFNESEIKTSVNILFSS